MTKMKAFFFAVVIALAVAGAVACEADLDGAPCPCVDGYTCSEVEHLCRPTIDSGPGPGTPDASLVPDSGFTPDAGFVPDGSVGIPDATVY